LTYLGGQEGALSPGLVGKVWKHFEIIQYLGNLGDKKSTIPGAQTSLPRSQEV